MPLAIGVFLEPTRESFEGKRLRIEGDHRIQDVVVINLRKPGHVGDQCQPGRDITHFECFSSRFYSTMRRAEPQLRLRLRRLTLLPGPHTIDHFSTAVRSIRDLRRPSPEV